MSRVTHISINQHKLQDLQGFQVFPSTFPNILLMVRENDRESIPSDPSDPECLGEWTPIN